MNDERKVELDACEMDAAIGTARVILRLKGRQGLRRWLHQGVQYAGCPSPCDFSIERRPEPEPTNEQENER
ncbi:MAG: hypothetical protein RIB60_06185 [Phycisphaerales bacterium]